MTDTSETMRRQCLTYSRGHEVFYMQALRSCNDPNQQDVELVDADTYSFTVSVQGGEIMRYWMHDRALLAECLKKRGCPDFRIRMARGVLTSWGTDPGEEYCTGTSIAPLDAPIPCDIWMPEPPSSCGDGMALERWLARTEREGAGAIRATPDVFEKILHRGPGSRLEESES